MRITIATISIFVCLFVTLCQLSHCNKDQTATKAQKKKLPKDPLYITDLDLENLFDEWEESDEDKLPDDELEPHKRPRPKTPLGPDGSFPQHLFSDPDKLMKISKKGKPVMAFVTVANNPTREDTDILTQRWQVGLLNMHMKCERFLVSDDRAIFMFPDGSLAFDAKDFLVSQPELKEYSIDNRVWQGKGYPVESVYRNQSMT